MLDLGAGPGIASWAVAEAWPRTSAATLVEAEAEMARAGRKLAETGPDVLRGANWSRRGRRLAGAQRGSRRRLVSDRRADAGCARRAGARGMGANHRHARDHRARHDDGLPKNPRRARHRGRGRWLDPRAVPSRRGVPTPRRTTGATSRCASPAAERTEPRRTPREASRTRSSAYVVLCREPHPRAGGTRAPASRPSPRARRPRSVHAVGARAADGLQEGRRRPTRSPGRPSGADALPND